MVEAKVLGIGRASDGDQKLVTFKFGSVVEGDLDVVLSDGSLEAATEMLGDTGALEGALKDLGEVGIHASEQTGLHLNDGDLTSQLGKDAGKLTTNVAAAKDEEMAGLLLEGQDVIAV